MSSPPKNPHAIAAFRRFYTLLPRTEDSILVILKLHLLVEEQVRAFVDERMNNELALKNARLNCNQAICLAEALCSDDIHPNFWEAARKLNRLRNEVAHKIEPEGVLKEMSAICLLLGQTPQAIAMMQPDGKATPLESFTFAIALLYNKLSVHVKRKPGDILRLV